MKMLSTRLGLMLLSCVTLAACGKTREEARVDMDRLMNEAKVCGPSDQCVLAGGGQCTCAGPVNASASSSVEAAADEVNQTCGGVMVDCVYYVNVRCERGQCVADNGP